MFLGAFCDAAERPAWRFREKNGATQDANPSILVREASRLGGFSVTRTEYMVTGGRAVRLLVSDGAQIAAIVDAISLDAPRCVYTPFSMPQTDDLSCNVASKSRLVLRAGGRGAKLFRMTNRVDGADLMDGCGLLLPDGFAAGTLRITPYSGLYAFGCRHLSVFALAEAADEKIKGWHMEGADVIEITAPDKRCRLRISLDEAGVTLNDPFAEAAKTVAIDA
ncbi:MAG: hypothetical protein IKV00_07875 [Clostridia bacterium]|nr:hypothetical protein [Clostridia bacterium]